MIIIYSQLKDLKIPHQTKNKLLPKSLLDLCFMFSQW